MKRYSLIGLLTLLVAVTVWGSIVEVPEAPARMTAVVVGGVGVGAAPESWTVTEDFTSIAEWTVGGGTPSVSGGVLTSGTWESYMLWQSTTALSNAYREYSKVKITAYSSGDIHLMFRITDYNSAKYGIKFNGTGASAWYFQYGTESTQIGTGENTMTPTVATNVWIGAEVENTGTDTIYRMWTWASDPGDRSAWGTADATITDNPGTAANTGTYCGLAANQEGTANTLDSFSANSNASGP